MDGKSGPGGRAADLPYDVDLAAVHQHRDGGDDGDPEDDLIDERLEPDQVHPDGVDRPTTLNQQIDCLRDLIFATVRRLDKVAGVEDCWQERIESRPNEVRGWILGYFDDVGNLAVLVRITNAVSAGFVLVNLLDEERGVGAVFALPADDVREVCLEDVVAEHEHEIVVDVLFDRQ